MSSDLGRIICDITLTKSCRFRRRNSTNIPSQYCRPVHQRVYTLSLSLTRTPLWGSLLMPSSPTILKCCSSKGLWALNLWYCCENIWVWTKCYSKLLRLLNDLRLKVEVFKKNFKAINKTIPCSCKFGVLRFSSEKVGCVHKNSYQGDHLQIKGLPTCSKMYRNLKRKK